MEILFIILILGIFLLSGVTIWASLAICALATYLWIIQAANPAVIGIVIWNTLDSFVLVAVPMFIFMGSLLNNSGLSDRVYTALEPWTKSLPGGLLHTNIWTCAVFSACSGSSTATSAAVGVVAYPPQKQRGYDARMVTGSLAAGGTLGILIPPSIPFVIYGGTTGDSVTLLFAAGLIPGIIMAVLYSLYIAIRVTMKRSLTPLESGASWKEKFSGIWQIWPILVIVAWLMSSIYTGFATPTEASALGALVSLILGRAFGNLNWRILRTSMLETLGATSMIFVVVLCASLLSTGLGYLKVGSMLISMVSYLNASPVMVLITVCLIYLVLGCFFDGISIMVMTIPFFVPLMTSVGFNSIWFAVILVILIGAGNITPPVGLNVFVIRAITKEKLSVIFEGVMPYVVIMVIGIVIFTVFPELVMYLPRVIKQ